MAPVTKGSKQQQQQEELQQPLIQRATSSQEDSSAITKKTKGPKEAHQHQPMYSMENLQNNMKAVNYGRSFMAIIAGVVTGVLGFTGVMGFLCYFTVMLLCSWGFLLKTGFNTKKYFDTLSRVTLDGLFGGALSFVLFWTLAYDIVHIF